MTNQHNNITSKPFAKWFEQTLHDIMDFPVRGIAVALVSDTGDTYINYYETTMADKILIAGLINQDANLDMMAANGFIEYSDDEEEGAKEDT